MPQLRNAETSALIAESTDPRDLVLIAETVGLERVLFDEVGEGFDVGATIAAARERIAPPPTGLDRDTRSALLERVKAAKARHDALEGPATEAVAALLDGDDPDPDPVVVDAIVSPE